MDQEHRASAERQPGHERDAVLAVDHHVGTHPPQRADAEPRRDHRQPRQDVHAVVTAAAADGDAVDHLAARRSRVAGGAQGDVDAARRQLAADPLQVGLAAAALGMAGVAPAQQQHGSDWRGHHGQRNDHSLALGMRHGLRATLVAAFVAVGFGAGCPVASADDPVPEATTTEGRQTVADDPSIVGSRPLRVEAWSPAGSPDAVSVHFMLGSPGCSGVHAVVRETDTSVTVDLREGTRPESVGRMCTMIVVPAALDVGLQSPLGNRAVLSAF